MCIRAYQERDLDQLKHIHAQQGFPYEFPDLSNPLFLTKVVLTDGDSDAENFAAGCEEKVCGAAFLRLTAEAYLLLDPSAGTARQRWQTLLHLHAAAHRDA